MTKAEIAAMLEDFEHWRGMSNAERQKFARAMRPATYGRDALEIACAFWIHGYRTAHNEQQ